MFMAVTGKSIRGQQKLPPLLQYHQTYATSRRNKN